MQFFLLTFSLQFCKLNDLWLNDFCLRPQNHDPKIIKKVVKICFVRLNFIKKYCIVIFIGNEKSRCVRVATYIHSVTVRTEVVSMVESVLLSIIYLLFYGLIGITIINIALIITLVIFLSK